VGHPALASLDLHLDRTPQQFAYDLAIIVVVLANVFAGARHGLIRRALALAGVFGGAAAATYVGRSLVRTATGGNALYADAWGFVLVFGVVVGIVELLGVLYRSQIAGSSALAFDRVAGAVAGLIVGAAEVAVLILVALAMGNAQPRAGRDVPASHAQLSNELSSSTVGGLFVNGAPGLSALFSPVLPADFSDHLSSQ